MSERYLETTPANTPTTTPTPTIRKRRYSSTSFCPTHPVPRVARKEFWTARLREIPIFRCNPWDFYEPFLKRGSYLSHVLCNDATEVRTMRIFDNARKAQPRGGDADPFTLLELQHPSFVDIYEVYLYKNEIFVIFEYISFSIADLLQFYIYASERENAYITSQVLAGIRFIWSQDLRHPRISARNVHISPKGEVKIDHTLFADNDEHSSADLNSLGTIILEMMNETRDTLHSTLADWSAELVNFIEATSFATPDELSDHVFVTRAGSAEILTPLFTLAHSFLINDVAIDKDSRRRLR